MVIGRRRTIKENLAVVEEMQFLKTTINNTEAGVNSPLQFDMQENQISYPTIGELVREIFNASGLLASKSSKDAFLSSSQKKSIQTKIKRLADESSKIEGKLKELGIQFSALLEGINIDEKVRNVVIACVDEVLLVYKSVLNSDGTYTSKRESMKYFLEHFLIGRIVFSLHKNYLKFNLPDLRSDVPNVKLWILPAFDSQKILWPLANAWKQIYSQLGVSQSYFHYPDKKHEDLQAIRNLENAQHWSSKGQLPSISALYDNFDYSVELLKRTCNKQLSANFRSERLKSFKLMLFIARVATYLFQRIEASFGREYLESIIKQIMGASARLSRINQGLAKDIEIIRSQNYLIRQADIDSLHFSMVDNFWEDYSNRVLVGSETLQELIEEKIFDGLSDFEVKRIVIFCLGSLAAQEVLANKSYQSIDFDKEPNRKKKDFFELLHEGFNLRKSPPSISDIEAYERELESRDLKNALLWLSEWCYANFYYDKKDFLESHVHYEKAFNHAKYCAGENQYSLVNQYIESCAKVHNRKAMKKAIAWAHYMGIEVRLIRNFDDPESEESIDFIYEIMGNHDYHSFPR
ncbi:hypothetical protein [Alteromonas sp. a30]|uniref:hypothetical protein n=1 Tax=Alteromonas sp. a30 TaxID=2730917 RepID=UPI00227EC1EE|nr:hypothetical protein [Alteromonas sp. a30]MCY7294979.1 hypothetical protein [Alteromonas sp. a30]